MKIDDISVAKMAYALYCTEYTKAFEYPMDFDRFVADRSLCEQYKKLINDMFYVLSQDKEFVGVVWISELEHNDYDIPCEPLKKYQTRLKCLSGDGAFNIDNHMEYPDNETIPRDMCRKNLIYPIVQKFGDYMLCDKEDRKEFLISRDTNENR